MTTTDQSKKQIRVGASAKRDGQTERAEKAKQQFAGPAERRSGQKIVIQPAHTGGKPPPRRTRG